MNYPSIRIEGSILSPDILEKLDDVSGQRPADFGLETSTKVKDEIARAWADAQDYWRIFNRKLETLKGDSPATTETRNLWIVPLLGLLGYQLEFEAKSIELNGKLYPISHRITNRGDAAIHIIGSRELAGLDRKPEKVALRMSAHAMMQEYLNLTEQLYGIVTNGRLLRLLRDSSRLVKLTYLEFDLDRIFSDGLFADFAILYRLLHVTRLPATQDTSADSIIERYHQDSLDSGARIRDGLSKAVETAIRTFANGFLSNADNNELLAEISSERLQPGEFYHYLLRLIYRILFVMVIEERNLVYPLSPSPTKRSIYDRYYSLMRLRRLSEKRYLADRRHNDHWLALLACFRLFEDGGPGSKLGIAPLAGDLFRPDAIGTLCRCTLDNETLLHCLRALNMYENPNNGQVIRVNYAALNVEEFGSVYEGLLEYEPVFIRTDKTVEFAFALGDERAATGSHYTPDDLVQPLIRHSLDYLIGEKLKQPNPEQGLLSLRVADISCGSGHILLAAARRIATELAIVRTGEEQPSPGAFRTAVRDVICNCIYGVDLNPLAVELCKVALWLEAHIPGQPLNFLDHHIKCGNAIVGFSRRDELERGVPDEAYVTMPGDDKEVAASFRKRNKEERLRHSQQLPKQEHLAFSPEVEKHLSEILKGWRTIAALPERNPAEIEAKKNRYQEFASGQDAWLLSQIAAIPVAQFYIEKTQENSAKLITDEEYRRYLAGQRTPQGQGTAMAWSLVDHKRIFHWFLEFPEIIEQGGFDCILGNPPFLGGQKLSRSYGHGFLNWLKYYYGIVGSCDLVTYFYRRTFNLLRPNGYMSLISTNSISQGVAREGGLEIILQGGGTIIFAVPSQRWPGRAAVEVSIISIYNGVWKKAIFLNHKEVPTISSYLDDTSDDESPSKLIGNKDKCFMGSTVVGAGFILTPNEAKALISNDKSHATLVLPYLNGNDLNSDPAQHASRYIITFGEMPLRRCETKEWDELNAELRNKSRKFGIVEPDYKNTVASDCQQLIQLVESRVRASREKEKLSDKAVAKWWQFYRPTVELYKTIAKLSRVIVTAQVSKTAAFDFVNINQVFDAKLIVFAFEDYASFAILQSCFHINWTWKYCTTMNTDLSYGPERLFLTYPFPEMYQNSLDIAQIGHRNHEHRRQLMLKLQLGLTKTYKLFHSPNLSASVIAKESKQSVSVSESAYTAFLQYRELQIQMDLAVLAAYGWHQACPAGPALNLHHDFYEVDYLPENDRVRYTISPDARKELLKRLLALNHQQAAEERAKAPVKAVKVDKVKAAKGKKAAPEVPELFDLTPLALLSFPSTPREKIITAAALAIIEKAGEVSSMDHLDVLLLATHPEWCKAFLNTSDRKLLNSAVAELPLEFSLEDHEPIKWKDCRDYLEKRQALQIDRTSQDQIIQPGQNIVAVKASLPPGTESIVAVALEALKEVQRLRERTDSALEDQKLVLQIFEQRHQEYRRVA